MMKQLLQAALLAFPLSMTAQDGNGPRSLTIHTNAVCDMCVKTIETEMLYEKGVKAVKVDLEANVIHVDIDPRKTDLAKVRTAITHIGYAADGEAPDAKARERLPDCCKKDGCGLPAKPEPPTPEDH